MKYERVGAPGLGAVLVFACTLALGACASGGEGTGTDDEGNGGSGGASGQAGDGESSGGGAAGQTNDEGGSGGQVEGGNGGEQQGGDAGGAGGTQEGGQGGGGQGGGGQGGGGQGGGGQGGGGQGGTAGVPIGPAEVQFVGRVLRDQTGVRFAWSGTGFVFRLNGTGATVRMDDQHRQSDPNGYLTVLIDGKEQPTLETTNGEKDYVIAAGLPAGEHQVEVYRQSEPWFGETRFVSVTIEGGALLAPLRNSLRMEVIGDSISAGFGNEGAGPSCSWKSETSNHYLTYGAVAARNIGADVVTIARSGRGLVYNRGTDNNNNVVTLYERIMETYPNKWDFSLWKPHVVVINLGTNDFDGTTEPTKQVYQDAYTAFLKRIRKDYPQAWIICLTPTMLTGAKYKLVEGYIAEMVQSLGDGRVIAHSLKFSSSGIGCSYHPSVATHENMATALTTELQKLNLGQ